MSTAQDLADALTHHRAGRLVEAEELYRQVLAAEPENADALHLLGLVEHQSNRPEEALRHIAAAIAIAPQQATFFLNLGRVYHSLGRPEEERIAYERALQLDPALAPAYLHAALALQEEGRLAEAAGLLRQAIAIKPDYAQAWFNLGLVCQEQWELDQAVAAYTEAARCDPRMAAAHFNRGNALRQQRKLEEAAAAYREAAGIEPERAGALLNLGHVLGELGRSEESVECFHRVIRLQPDSAEAHHGLAATLLSRGEAEAARAELRRAVELRPDWAVPHSAAIGCEQYLPGVTEASLAASHAEWDRLRAAPLRSTWRHANSRDPQRRLRWGMVAPDFGDNPVGHFLIRVMEALDPQECEVYCYAGVEPSGPLGERFRRAAGAWCDAGRLSDEALAGQIRADQVDVLFDLAGHTADNRLLVFARKPAPIQITWIAYPGTTGMEAMDYIIADAREIPPGSEAHYRERVMRLADGYVCYDPPADSPAVGPLPALTNGHVTFASFNNPLKISAQAAALWAAILRRVPGSRLVIKYFGLADEATRRRIREMLVAEGADADRIELVGEAPRGELLAAYNKVDIALDPLPYTGGLTTCEALWMGVPVVTCRGETFAGRHSASHLANVGLGEWIAADVDQYLELAVKWASDLDRLAALRAGLRGRMLASPLCDGRRLAENLSRLVRQAWREWASGEPRQ